MIRRILKTYSGWLFLLLLFYCSGFYLINRLYNEQVLQQHEDYLEQKAEFLIQLTKKQTETIDELATYYLKGSEERITLMDEKGHILFDSFEPSLSGNRENRPEVKAVLSGNEIGKATRNSPTLHKELLYIALPIKEAGKIHSVLRLAEPTSAFLPNAQKMKWAILLVFSLLCFLLSTIILFILYRRDRPIETILPAIHKMLESPEQPETILATSSQWEELYQAINKLGQQMSHSYQINTSKEKQLYQLLNELQIGVFMIASNGDLLLMNATMQEQLGATFTTVQPFPEVIHDTHLIQMIYQVTSDKPLLQEERRISKTQRLLDLTIRYSPETDQLLGLSYDLTRLRQLEKAQQDFVSNVSHELKTPVTSLIGFTETLLDGAKDDPDTLTEFLKIMHKDTLGLQHLIQDIIQLSKDATIDYPVQTVTVKTSLQTILSDYQNEIDQKELKIILKGPSDFLFSTKEKLFTSILKNLIENAIYYSLPNGEIILSFEEKNGLSMTIEDHGIGIEKKEQERIFERFYRIDKARSRNSGGTGLGLAIVKDHVKTLNGTIEVDSHLGVGTIFRIFLPYL